MTGDFSRMTFDRRNRYSAVLQQQGRVGVDADWNEWVELVSNRMRVEAIDVIGARGRPRHAPGFRLNVDPDQIKGVAEISAGRFYVSGLLCELDRPVDIRTQPDWPVPSRSTWQDLFGAEEWPGFPSAELQGRRVLFYLEAGERHLTALQDEARRDAQLIAHGDRMRERALGGPDTCTRLQIVAQVKHLAIPTTTADCAAACAELRRVRPERSTAGLQLKLAVHPPVAKPCETPQDGGYGGPEHRTYRLEIHEPGLPGQATFKWSHENGAFTLRIQTPPAVQPPYALIAGADLAVLSLGLDQATRLGRGDWVEVCGEETELGVFRNPITQITDVPREQPDGTWLVRLDRHVVVPQAPFLRRWSGPARTIEFAQDLPLDPLSGIQVAFAPLDTRTGAPAPYYHAQDYWTWVGRADIRAVEPEELTRSPRPPRGPARHYACLAVYDWHGDGKNPPDLIDECVQDFPPLTELPAGRTAGCCALVVHDGKTSSGQFTSIAEAVKAIPETGAVLCLAAGRHVIQEPILLRASRVVIRGCGPQTVIDAPHGAFVLDGRESAVDDIALVDLNVTVRHGPVVRARHVGNLLVRDCRFSAIEPDVDLRLGLIEASGEGIKICGCRFDASGARPDQWISGIDLLSSARSVDVRDNQFDGELAIGVSLMSDERGGRDERDGSPRGLDRIEIVGNRWHLKRGVAIVGGNWKFGLIRDVRIDRNIIEVPDFGREYEPRIALRSPEFAPGVIELIAATNVRIVDNVVRVESPARDVSAILIEGAAGVALERNDVFWKASPGRRYHGGVVLDSLVSPAVELPENANSVLENRVFASGGPALLGLALQGDLSVSRNRFVRAGSQVPEPLAGVTHGAVVHLSAPSVRLFALAGLLARPNVTIAARQGSDALDQLLTLESNEFQFTPDVPDEKNGAVYLVHDGDVHFAHNRSSVAMTENSFMTNNTLIDAGSLRVLGNHFHEAFAGVPRFVVRSCLARAAVMLTAVGNQATHCLEFQKKRPGVTRQEAGLNIELNCPRVDFAPPTVPPQLRSFQELAALRSLLKAQAVRLSASQPTISDANVTAAKSAVQRVDVVLDLSKRLAEPNPASFTLQCWVVDRSDRPLHDCRVTVSTTGPSKLKDRLKPAVTDARGLATIALPTRQFPELTEQDTLFVLVESRRGEILFQSVEPIPYRPGQVVLLPVAVMT